MMAIWKDSEIDLSLCTCGHVRLNHDADADHNGEHFVMSYGGCTRCECEGFEERI